MANIKKSCVTKPVREMTYEEQLASLAENPRFKALVADIKTLSVDRQDALAAEMAAMTD